MCNPREKSQREHQAIEDWEKSKPVLAFYQAFYSRKDKENNPKGKCCHKQSHTSAGGVAVIIEFQDQEWSLVTHADWGRTSAVLS